MIGLSNLQKREISIAARAAYDRWPEREAFEAINSEMSRSACFDAWRHVETRKAVGIESLRECTQAHYGRALAHFQSLAGHQAIATRTLARDQDNGRRIALHKLTQALGERGLSVEYAAQICRNQFRCSIAAASEKQLWCLMYTVRNRRSAMPRVKIAAPSAADPF